jgi:hypothetical protein
MTSRDDEFDERVTDLEREVRIARQDAAAARILAGGADRDVAEHGAKLDLHKALLDALRETQIEHGEKIDSLEQRVSRGFSMLAVGQSEILALLNRLDGSPSD